MFSFTMTNESPAPRKHNMKVDLTEDKNFKKTDAFKFSLELIIWNVYFFPKHFHNLS